MTTIRKKNYQHEIYHVASLGTIHFHKQSLKKKKRLTIIITIQ